MKLLLFTILLYILLYLLRSQYPAINLEIELFNSFRDDISQRISNLLPSPQAELLSGILLGHRGELPADFQLALRDTSTLHMVVVSGQNLTMLSAAVLASIAGLLRRKLAVIITLAVTLLYVLMTGAQIPVLRAALMAGIVFMAEVSGRQKTGVIALVASALLLLLVNPAWVTSISFQLSFLATFGVIVVAPVILNSVLASWPNFAKQDLAVTIGAQLTVLPIIAYYFHQISIVGVVANLMVIWTIPIIMILGFFVILASFILQPLAAILSFLVNILLTYFVYVVKFSASLPFAWEYIGEIHWVFWIGYYLLLLGMVQLIYAQTTLGRRLEKNIKNTKF